MFDTLDCDLLSTIHGGQQADSAGPNQGSDAVSAPVPGTPPVWDRKASRSDYGYCVDTVKDMGGTVDDLLRVCGQPPAPVAP